VGMQPHCSARDGGAMTVRDLVWGWLSRQGARRTFYLSDVTKGLCGPQRQINHLTDEPRAAVREALVQLADEGCLSLSPTTHSGRGGKAGLQIRIESRGQVNTRMNSPMEVPK